MKSRPQNKHQLTYCLFTAMHALTNGLRFLMLSVCLIYMQILPAPISFAEDQLIEDQLDLDEEASITEEPIEGFVVGDQGVLLNLRDVDIKTLVEAMSKYTNINYIIDPRVSGRVSIISSRHIPLDRLDSIFASILAVHGFTVVPGESADKIVPFSLAKATSRQGLDKVETRIIPLEHAEPEKVVAALRPFVSEQGYLAQLEDSIIISDTLDNINRVLNILQDLDAPLEESYEIIDIEFGNAQSIAETLESHAGKIGLSAAVTVDKDFNRLIVSGREKARRALRTLAEELDRPLPASSNVRVIELLYADAEDIAEVLRNLVSNVKLGDTESSPDATADTSNDSNEGLAATTGSTNETGTEVSIQAFTSLNALIISAPTAVMSSLLHIIETLDQQRTQVVIEAIVAEISSQDAESFGAELSAWSTQFGGLASDPSNNFVLPPLIKEYADTGDVTALPSLSGSGFGFLQTSENRKRGFGALLQIIRSQTNSQVLSTPSITTLDNQEATILIGDEVPIITRREEDNNSDPFQNIERKEIGLKLTVTPQINASDVIRLEIEQEISDINDDIASRADVVDIVTSKRTISTSVLVKDQNIIVLGGLLRQKETDIVRKVPILGDIPLLGNLFQSRAESVEELNLIVFIRPQILKLVDLEGDVGSHEQNLLDKINSRDLQNIFKESLLRYQLKNDANDNLIQSPSEDDEQQITNDNIELPANSLEELLSEDDEQQITDGNIEQPANPIEELLSEDDEQQITDGNIEQPANPIEELLSEDDEQQITDGNIEQPANPIEELLSEDDEQQITNDNLEQPTNSQEEQEPVN